ncbi:MAG: 16S rRNA (cytosine(1402)-N(4))-methyltransferase RsmH [Planctomycetaceae bacterium]
MNDSVPDKPERRPRYRGTHPRQFGEKYKEHQPERYAEDVARVVARGRTPAGTHRPIMVAEILTGLAPRPGQLVIDCTLGYGGHARELLAAIQPGGKLLGFDVDPVELPKTEARLRQSITDPQSLIVRRSNFAGLSRVAMEVFPEGADLILADLGLSSMQLDDPQRGFTFKLDAPLDMRMNPQHGQSAAALLSKVTETKLAAMLKENADEPRAVRLARAIMQTQQRTSIESTRTLADVVRDALDQTDCDDDEIVLSIRRVFQALRIAVNDEFGALDSLLSQIPYCLRPGGRVAILTFHSGEDRRVKQAFKAGLAAGIYTSVTDTVIRATPEEQHSNPRSAPAKLRLAVR